MPDNTGARLLGVRAVTMLSCPEDPVLGMRMYPAPCRFPRSQFQETLAAGYWPDGSVWRYAAQYRGAPTLWRVSEARHRHPYLVFAIYCTAAVAVSIAAGVALELWLCP